MPPKISAAQLHDAFVSDLANAWGAFREKYPNHTPYAFALFGIGYPARLTPAFLTEESLTEVALQYLEKDMCDTLEEARQAMRYAVGDSPLCNEFDHLMSNVDRLFGPTALEMEDEAAYRLLSAPAVAALKELDSKGYFGSGEARENFVLAIATDEVETNRWSVSVRELNSNAAAVRLLALTELEGPYTSCNRLCVADDGKNLLAIGSKKISDKPGPHDSVSEITCYAIVGPTIQKRWEFQFPGFGDSGRGVCAAPDGKSFVVLRGRYEEDKSSTTILMRFREDSNQPIQEKSFPGDAFRIAMSPDGKRIAVTEKNVLTILDEAFNVLYRRQRNQLSQGLLFLSSSELLLGNAQRIVRVDAETGEVIAELGRPGFFLSSDRQRRFLAAGGWYSDAKGHRDDPFGFAILSLPAFELHRELALPEKQLLSPVISPDGKLVAAVVKKPGNFRDWTVVFDVATGEVICERRSSHENDLAFVPDGQALLIAGTSYGGTPIVRWPIQAAGKPQKQ